MAKRPCDRETPAPTTSTGPDAAAVDEHGWSVNRSWYGKSMEKRPYWSRKSKGLPPQLKRSQIQQKLVKRKFRTTDDDIPLFASEIAEKHMAKSLGGNKTLADWRPKTFHGNQVASISTPSKTSYKPPPTVSIPDLEEPDATIREESDPKSCPFPGNYTDALNKPDWRKWTGDSPKRKSKRRKTSNRSNTPRNTNAPVVDLCDSDDDPAPPVRKIKTKEEIPVKPDPSPSYQPKKEGWWVKDTKLHSSWVKNEQPKMSRQDLKVQRKRERKRPENTGTFVLKDFGDTYNCNKKTDWDLPMHEADLRDSSLKDNFGAYGDYGDTCSF